VHHDVKVAQEFDCLQILAPAIAVGQPFVVLARIVEVEHRGHGIDANTVDVKFTQPVVCRGEQKAFYFAPAVIENQSAPVLMRAEPRVGVFIQRGAVELRQCPIVPGEMRGHPIQNDADLALVAGVDKGSQLVRRSKAAGRREVAGRLVAPGFIQRMLGQRHELDMGVAHFTYIGHQMFGQLSVAVDAAIGVATPGANVHFVDIVGCMLPVQRFAPFQPSRVVPCMARQRCNARRGAGAQLEGLRIGVGFDEYIAGVAVANFKFVQTAGC